MHQNIQLIRIKLTDQQFATTSAALFPQIVGLFSCLCLVWLTLTKVSWFAAEYVCVWLAVWYLILCYINLQVFEGNSDSFSIKHSYLDGPILARFLKFHTIHWNKHPSMRIEIIGCQGNGLRHSRACLKHLTPREVEWTFLLFSSRPTKCILQSSNGTKWPIPTTLHCISTGPRGAQ